MNTILCDKCVPDWSTHEVLTIVPLGPCCQCGQRDERHKGGLRCHLFRGDPRTAHKEPIRVNHAQAEPVAVPYGYALVPVEPTPEIIAAAAIAVWPTASAEDIELARKAAPIVLMGADLGPGHTVETLAAALATMAPAYRAMIAAAPKVQP